jgi:hypothetical protein
MPDTKQMLQRARERFVPPEDVMGSLVRRRKQKERNRRISAALIAIVLTLLSIAALTHAFPADERPATEPTPPAHPKPQGIFSPVGGWIVYGPLNQTCEPTPCGNEMGIWAADPARRDDPDAQIQLSTNDGTPLAWSPDGSRLLILRTRNVPHQASMGSNLFVLNADGTETRLTKGNAWLTGGSFSADGSEVVYATTDGGPPGIFVVDAAGGTPRALLPGEDLHSPTFSPDGSKIAYLAPGGANDYRLRVMNADGTGSRELSQEVLDYEGHDLGLVWSPDGTRLAIDLAGDIYTIGADGSDLTLVIPHGGNPNWSPDGSRIAYDFEDVSYPPGPHLEIADADGTNIQMFISARSGPWNPLIQPEPDVAVVPSGSEGPTPSNAAVLAPLATVALIRRRRREASPPARGACSPSRGSWHLYEGCRRLNQPSTRDALWSGCTPSTSARSLRRRVGSLATAESRPRRHADRIGVDRRSAMALTTPSLIL